LTFLLWGFLLSPIQAEEITEVSPEVILETTEILIIEQSITTGEAAAEVESNNEIDNNPKLEVGNSAVATTGENQSSNDDDTDITVDTGEATAEIINQNQVNTNVLDVATTTVENNNEAEVAIENEAAAATGENEVVTNNADVQVNTGETNAYVNVINLINTNVVGTNLGIYLINNFDQEWANLDLNQMWLKLMAGEGTTVIEAGSNDEKMVIISNRNLVNLNNVVTVVATSGNNSVNGGNEVLIVTGNATAVANVINLVNTNLVGGQFFIGVVNVLGENLGDIILPNPEKFQNAENSNNNGGSVTINSNQAVLDNTVITNSNSGNNATVNVNNSMIETGTAQAYSNDLSIVNLNAELNNQMLLQLNVLGESSGKIYNLSFPGSVEEIGNNQLLFVLNENGCLDCQNGNDLVINNNSAQVTNSILLTADSGGNQIIGANNSTINSGSAWSIANLTNLINLNIQGSDWFWGIINVLGNWKGNIIFAYPDLAVGLSANKDGGQSGEEVIYRINYNNLGYEMANEVDLEIDLPAELIYISDDSGLQMTREGNKLKWKINNLAANSGSSFNLTIKLGDLVEKKDIQVQVLAMVQTKATESNLNNNQSVWATVIWYPIIENNRQVEGNNNNSNRVTKVILEAKNNVNNYVLPNDTVTFQIEIKNTGEGKMKEAILIHQIFDEQGNLWSENSLYLGDIDINKAGKMDFGMVMSEAGGKYTTKTWIVGLDENNNEVSSNVAETDFVVKRKIVLKKGQVLGAEDDYVYESQNNSDGGVTKNEKLIYWLLFLVSLVYIQRQIKIWLRRIK